MRGIYDEIQRRGAEVVAIGTGNVRYAAAFVADEDVPFPVRVGFLRLLTDRRSRDGAKRARAGGHKIHKAGRRVTQLGATFVVGPGSQVRYEHLDDHSADHAALDEVLAALPPVAAT